MIGAESGAVETQNHPEAERGEIADAGCNLTPDSRPLNPEAVPVDPELARVIAAWPTLPADVKAAVVAMVMAGRRGGLTDDRNGKDAVPTLHDPR